MTWEQYRRQQTKYVAVSGGVEIVTLRQRAQRSEQDLMFVV
jgi:hypothetical protein